MPIPHHVLQDVDVFHTNPPMTVQQVMGRLDMIENRDPAALANLLGDQMMLNYFQDARRIYAQEWGAAREAVIVNPECILISGGAHGVAWAPYLNAGLVPLAHSHPFHRNGHNFGRALADGGVLWNDINGVNPNQKLAARLKVFPSAGDVAFCAAQHLAVHIVKTPYCVVNPANNAGIVWIVNYDANPAFGGAPRLHFRIFDVREMNQNHYRASLVAMRGNTDFWRQHDINVFGGGGAGLDL